MAQHFSPASATIESDGADACIVTAGADDPERMALYLAMVGSDFEILEPPEVARAVSHGGRASPPRRQWKTTGAQAVMPSR